MAQLRNVSSEMKCRRGSYLAGSELFKAQSKLASDPISHLRRLSPNRIVVEMYFIALEYRHAGAAGRNAKKKRKSTEALPKAAERIAGTESTDDFANAPAAEVFPANSTCTPVYKGAISPTRTRCALGKRAADSHAVRTSALTSGHRAPALSDACHASPA